MTSEGNSALLPANVDHLSLLQGGLMNFQLPKISSYIQITERLVLQETVYVFCFPQISMFSEAKLKESLLFRGNKMGWTSHLVVNNELS